MLPSTFSACRTFKVRQFLVSVLLTAHDFVITLSSKRLVFNIHRSPTYHIFSICSCHNCSTWFRVSGNRASSRQIAYSYGVYAVNITIESAAISPETSVPTREYINCSIFVTALEETYNSVQYVIQVMRCMSDK